MLPSCMTAMRSLTPSTSSMSLEISKHRSTFIGGFAQPCIDFMSRAHINTTRGFIADQHAREARQPLGQNHLLLVAPGQFTYNTLRPHRVNVEVRHLKLGVIIKHLHMDKPATGK